MNKINTTNAVIIAQILAIILLIIYTFNNNHPVFWDEAYYMLNVGFLKKHGFSDIFLEKIWGPAGPLYAWFHYFLEPITGLASPGARLANTFSLLLIIIILAVI